MKRIVSLTGAVFLLIFSNAQTVQLTTDKTTSLIFPYPIQHIDRGNKNVLVQAIKDPGNILLVKAAVKNFNSTNLSVVTTDGSFYSFPVQFAQQPSLLVYKISPAKEESLKMYANSILDNPMTMRGIHDKHWQIKSSVTGIYIRSSVIYYQLRLDNKSPLDYDIDFIRFYIRDKKKGKRTASQENELSPLCISGNIKQVRAHSSSCFVYALDKFTIPDAKYLGVEINERNGGRHLFLHITNRKILKARILPDIN